MGRTLRSPNENRRIVRGHGDTNLLVPARTHSIFNLDTKDIFGTFPVGGALLL